MSEFTQAQLMDMNYALREALREMKVATDFMAQKMDRINKLTTIALLIGQEDRSS